MAASSLLDVCRFNPTAGGTTDWTYSSAVTGYQSPAAANIVNGAQYSYRAESNDLTQWEVGTGTYNTSTSVLSRTTVLFNSSGGTSKITFSTVPQVAIVALAEDLQSKVTSVTNSLGADVNLTSAGTYFDGPSCAQGTSGTWLASGTVTLTNTSAEQINAKLWDGTTIIASSSTNVIATGQASISLSGVLSSPAANIRISCAGISTTTSKIESNKTGNSKDSTLTVVRIG